MKYVIALIIGIVLGASLCLNVMLMTKTTFPQCHGKGRLGIQACVDMVKSTRRN